MTDDEQPVEHDRRHPDFEPGNTHALVHGARSPRKIGPVALRIEQEARAAAWWPAYLGADEYRDAVAAWAWSEAVCEQLRRFLAEQGVEVWLTETSTEVEDFEQVSESRSRRRTTAQRVASALEMSRKWESAAAGHRSRLGLDPVSRVKIGRDLALTGAANRAGLTALEQRGADLIAASPADPDEQEASDGHQ